ncbi:rhodanese-like domain-containing protein [Halorhodospira halochloris]|nr:rhodanese-like domain-containing protein [Halorhodospira halochloris]
MSLNSMDVNQKYRCPAIALLLTIAFLALPHPAHSNYYSVAPDPGDLLQFNGVLVDIREPYEWQQTGIVEGSKTITYRHTEDFIEHLEPHLNQELRPIALICRTGNRTRQAAHLLSQKVDAPVINIEGGIFRLMHLGYRPVPYQDEEP